MISYLSVLKKYAVFRGRSSRREYWMSFLFHIIFIVVLASLDNFIGYYNPDWLIDKDYGWLTGIYAFLTVLPFFAIQIRRLHDVGKSGWYLFICLIPFVGDILLLVQFCTESNPGDNIYGHNPNDNLNPNVASID
jgi:uncharacterized membrane protein YhaH (DUF805 family)